MSKCWKADYMKVPLEVDTGAPSFLRGQKADSTDSSKSAQEVSPLLRALRMHFERYSGLTEPKITDGPAIDDL